MDKYIEYKLYLEDEKPLLFKVAIELNPKTFKGVSMGDRPKWTHLENNKCSHCLLSSDEFELCPLAVRIIPFVEELSQLSSVKKIKFDVIHFDQTKRMEAPAQDVLGSLLGLYMATSACPHAAFLRPMAYFHLPLADPDETLYRVLTMYRLGQYFKQESKGCHDSGFKQLQVAYDNMTIVNQMLSKRIREALSSQQKSEDGTINAIVLLDALSQYVPASTEHALEELAPIFKYYINN